MKNALKVLLLCLLGSCSVPRSVTPPAPTAAADPRGGHTQDWTWVQGAVFVPTNCVNEAQQWDEYDPVVNDRELHYASIYGINVVRVYLHYYVYLKKRAAFLASIEDFLQKADKYGIKTEFVFFDDCWNQPPPDLLSADYRYPAPVPGVHNSRWLVCPGDEVRNHYEQHRAGLRAYVQDVVNAHRADPRVAFWEIYNEPNKSEATVRLERDAMGWIKQAGTSIPVTATGKEFSGGPFSDFPSWHEYGGYLISGGAFSLCTECMNRQKQSIPGIVAHYKGKVGFIVWEFGIGRDNCRFAWGDDPKHPRKDETPTPFHGVVYPDGHPWSIGDAKALLGPERFERTALFRTSYFKDDSFTLLAKASVTPMIDFSLVNEAGVGSPDASAGVPREHFSVQYDGEIRTSSAGAYSFSAATDGRVEILVDGKPVAGDAVELKANQAYPIEVRYSHANGPANLRVTWSGPTFQDRLLEPATHPAGL
jgi:PA14 domain